MPSPAIDQNTLQNIITEQLGAPIVSDAWACDIFRNNALLIKQHNAYQVENGGDIEAKFSAVRHDMRPLAELLWEDYRYLSEGSRALRDGRDDFVLTEVSKPFPNANALSIEAGGVLAHIVCFRSTLLQFIHASYSKMYTLMSDTRDADCIPEHEHLLFSDQYSDTSLLAGFVNDIEILFDQRRLFLPIDPPHLADPYDYCELVEGTRRFLLAHELGHANFSPNLLIQDQIPPWYLPSISSTVLSEWDEEHWCDAFAIYAIMNSYKGRELVEATQHEIANTLVGILYFFTLMEIIDVPLREMKIMPMHHPPHWCRREMVRSIIKSHDVYKQDWKLRTTLEMGWRRLNSFRNFVGGVSAPESLGTVWSRSEFLKKLSDFGQSAHRLMGEQLHWEWMAVHGFSIQSLNAYEGEF